MSIFSQAYSQYYDMVYDTKDYAGEAEYVHGVIQKYAPGASSIIDLGCGTGAHAAQLSGNNYNIHGIDGSAEMVNQARARKNRLNRHQSASLSFSHGDVRTVRLQKEFDVALSLFLVINYQTTYSDVAKFIRTAHSHLQKGGIFIFDFWYGPAVIAHRPEMRVKRRENDRVKMVRIAESKMRPNENLVVVNYHIISYSKTTAELTELKETQIMRYYFLPEIELLLAQAGFQLLAAEEWMAPGKDMNFDTWYGVAVARK